MLNLDAWDFMRSNTTFLLSSSPYPRALGAARMNAFDQHGQVQAVNFCNGFAERLFHRSFSRPLAFRCPFVPDRNIASIMLRPLLRSYGVFSGS